MQQFAGRHFEGITGTTGDGGVIPDENTSKLNELADSIINRRADFFIGIQ
ncbi:MAG: hypothetical protein H7Z13_19885 [Ferruginibacter sp.]|nr:hypothetical protein [Ferruginibacter sp.]